MNKLHWLTLGVGIAVGIVIAPWVRAKLGL